MAYLDTYSAFARFHDGSELRWKGLRKAQAQWRYHWIARQLPVCANLSESGKTLREFGWERDWQA